MDKIPTQIVYNSDTPGFDHSVSFYNREVSSVESDRQILDKPLVVNCVGRVDLSCRFTTNSKYGRHDYYLMYLTRGALDAEICGSAHRIVPGDAVIFPPEREYHYSNSGKSGVQYLWTHFTGSEAEHLLESCGFGAHGVFKVGIDEKISAMFIQLMEEFIRRDSFFVESAAAKLTEILIAMRRRLNAADDQPAGSVSRVFESIRFIHDNYKKPLTNEQLAKIEHLSVSQYIELFKKCTGTTPRSYIIELRIRNSCDLLTRSDLTVAQAAQAVGYDDAHYFSRLFKSYRGVSPEQYRRSRS